MIDKSKLITILSDGAFHSGESLGQQLGVTRAAVWKAIKDIQSLGLEIYSVRGKGYQLACPLSLLNKNKILRFLNKTDTVLPGDLIVHFDTDSTNSYLLRGVGEGMASGTVCLSEHQSNGRGRRGRHWVSPLGANLYLSLLWRFSDGAARLSGLSLAIGLFLVKALEELGVSGAQVKWPNDVLWNDKKLAGILLEVVGETSGPCHVVCGIGLNVAMPPTASQTIDQAWIDLKSTGVGSLDRNQIAAVVIRHLLDAIQLYEDNGFNYFLPLWKQYDLTYERPVVIHLYNQVQEGIGKGVDERGMLLLETDKGISRYASGEVSLRFQEPAL